VGRIGLVLAIVSDNRLEDFAIAMLLALAVVILVSLTLSFFCSLMEANIYAVPLAHVRHLAESGSKKGIILLRFKEEISRPIAAILILNTIANTIGAALSGAIVGYAYGEKAVIVFSIVFTVLILCFSEILPKQIGAVYAKHTAELIAYPLLALT
jgi:Mg2+/Co2+ transporter CorB